MDKKAVIDLLSNLEDGVQEMIKFGEGDLRIIIHLIRLAKKEVLEERTDK